MFFKNGKKFRKPEKTPLDFEGGQKEEKKVKGPNHNYAILFLKSLPLNNKSR
jgi:hypothetical protein